MRRKSSNTSIKIFTILISFFSIIVCLLGLIKSNRIYQREVISYAAQAIGQDLITLIIVIPLLIIFSISYLKGNIKGILIWAACVFYLIYTYMTYTFGMHFNQLFLLYCIILGLSIYGFIFFLMNYASNIKYEGKRSVGAPFFLITISILFYCLWLSEIIPAISTNTIPKSIIDSNVTNNAIYIIDISICNPFLILVGILTMQKKDLGYILLPIALVFVLLLSLAIICMVGFMKVLSNQLDFGLLVVFCVISLIDLFFIITVLKKGEYKHL